MIWVAFAYHGRFELLRIVSNLNNNWFTREMIRPEIVLFLQSIPKIVFQQGNAVPHFAKNARGFFFSKSCVASSLAFLYTGYVAY